MSGVNASRPPFRPSHPLSSALLVRLSGAKKFEEPFLYSPGSSEPSFPLLLFSLPSGLLYEGGVFLVGAEQPSEPFSGLALPLLPSGLLHLLLEGVNGVLVNFCPGIGAEVSLTEGQNWRAKGHHPRNREWDRRGVSGLSRLSLFGLWWGCLDHQPLPLHVNPQNQLLPLPKGKLAIPGPKPWEYRSSNHTAPHA